MIEVLINSSRIVMGLHPLKWCVHCLFGVLHRFQHCTGHITTGSWKGRGNQYTYSWLGFCTVNCRPTASNYQLSHLRPCRESNPGLRGGRRECYHSATVAPIMFFPDDPTSNIYIVLLTHRETSKGL